MNRPLPLRIAGPLLAAAVVLALGCGEFVDATPDAASDQVTAEKPEGWESIDDESSSMRLYYQFVDERRQVRFVETLEEVPEALRATVGFVKMDVPPPLSPGDAARAREARRRASGPRIGAGRVADAATAGGGIVLYSAEWCGACKKAKRWLDRNDVDYELRDIDTPRWAQELMRKTGRRAVPVIDVEGRILTGFSAAGYEKLVASS
ncbi:MAG: glutaredoxin family protein [Myxococcota bacterium]